MKIKAAIDRYDQHRRVWWQCLTIAFRSLLFRLAPNRLLTRIGALLLTMDFLEAGQLTSCQFLAACISNSDNLRGFDAKIRPNFLEAVALQNTVV